VTGNVQGFTALVQQQAAAAQVAVATNSPGRVLTFTPGSILRSIFEAVAGVALWLQGMALNLLLYARATTATGADLDSWMADFQFTRIAGAASTCTTVVLGRYATSQAAVIVPGGTVQTADGSQQFTIIADTTQGGYSASAGGYTMASGVASVQVTVQNSTQGAAGNVAAGTITAFASGIVGADTVTNTAAAVGGADPETDAAFRARFWNYLQYLYRATAAAVTYAVTSLQAGATCSIADGYISSGVAAYGAFFVTVDDGSHAPSAAFIANANQAVQNTRALGIRAATYGVTQLVANIVATITVAPGFTSTVAIASASAAVQAAIAGLTQAQSLEYFPLGGAIAVAPGVGSTASLTINGVGADLVPTSTQTIVVGSINITIAS
jgi:uncharacterized phage protein gp47/JayE